MKIGSKLQAETEGEAQDLTGPSTQMPVTVDLQSGEQSAEPFVSQYACSRSNELKYDCVSECSEVNERDSMSTRGLSTLSTVFSSVANVDSDHELQILEAEIALEEERYKINQKKLAILKLRKKSSMHDVSHEIPQRGNKFEGPPLSQMSNLNLHDTVTLPKLEIEPFWGNPGEFIAFKNSFEQHVAQKIGNQQSKLAYLIFYCKGEAKDSIKHCPLLTDDVCYDEAWKILGNNFGRPHLVANAVLRDLIGGPAIKNELIPLQRLARAMRSCQVTLTRMNRICDLDNTSTLLQLVKRLPKAIQISWAEIVERALEANRNPTFENLSQLIERRIALLNNEFGQLAFEPSRPNFKEAENRTFRVAAARTEAASGLDCFICHGKHPVDSCPEFISESIEGRKSLLLSKRLCFNCLKPSHMAKYCRNYMRCSAAGCGRRHNSLIHTPQERFVEPTQQSTCGATMIKEKSFRLSFAPVKIIGPKGVFNTYAFIDDGSDTTLISVALSELTGITGPVCSLETQTLHGSKITKCAHASFEMKSFDESHTIKVDSAFIVDRLPVAFADVPNPEVIDQWKHLQGVKLPILQDSTVGILIGANVPECLWIKEQRLGNRHEPYAIRSVLGWTLRGPADNHYFSHKVNFLSSESFDLQPLIEDLFNAEFNDIGDPEAVSLSVDDERALEIAQKGANVVNCHYEIPVPWKIPGALLPNNKPMALKRLRSLKERLLKNESLKRQYCAIMQGHISNGYVSVASKTCNRWFLPHHPVTNPRKPGKLRIVFDCAARSNGTSLNDMLLQGPDLTNNLTAVLLRFRKHAIAFTADIREMFLQVRLPEKDRAAFSYLWWENENLEGEPAVFEWQVHPFGAKSSPFCSNFALKMVAREFKNEVTPSVLRALENSFYVDDYLGSAKSVEEGTNLVNELRRILKAAGFVLCKWASNESAVLQEVPSEEIITSSTELGQGMATQRALGVEWNMATDTFSFKISLREKKCTRRTILSSLATVFDPLGFVAPALLPAKILLQHLCRESFGWDTPASTEVQQHWKKWLEGIELIKTLQISRCLLPIDEHVVSTQLHVFSDASEVGYGAVGYIRYQFENESLSCKFLMGKARVAPLKSISIPRLELSAALLAAKLMDFLSRELDERIDATFLWTDSAVVLKYLSNTNSRFATFVANRIRRIKELSNQTQWRYVPTSQNPADVASRGTSKEILNDLKGWIEGPRFLQLKEQKWPSNQGTENLSAEPLELKRKIMAINASEPDEWFQKLCLKASSWSQLLKFVVWLTRFKFYLRILHTNLAGTFQTGALTAHEMKRAADDVVRLTQRKYFPKEPSEPTIDPISPCLQLKRLRPTEVNGILCLGGRIQLPEPLRILPAKARVTELIVEHFHKMEGHVGASHVLASIRRKYWVVKGMSVVKRVISRCLECRVQLAKPCEQVMAPLPKCRVEPGSYPFKHCGVDYFGPFMVKLGRARAKRFGCLFTCMQTRAIHIEVANDLSTDSFLMALVRFISRRGAPEQMYSDNGTNFVGAEAELKRLIQSMDQSKIADGLQIRGVEWNFNPPTASHRGGVWERMIRSVRKVLAHLVHEQTVSEEVLVTALAEAERIINDRPLIPVYDDPENPSTLRPNDLLLLRPNEGLVNEELPLTNRYCRQWRQSQHLANTFWRRWQLEYLPTLQKSQKWLKSHTDLRKGDLVLLRKTDSPRGCWPKGIVSEVYPGLDGKVRQVLVKTSKGLLRKDIRSLCFLEGTLS